MGMIHKWSQAITAQDGIHFPGMYMDCYSSYQIKKRGSSLLQNVCYTFLKNKLKLTGECFTLHDIIYAI